EHLGKDSGLADDRHEVRVTAPTRYHVLVQVGRNAGPGNLPRVDAYVETSRSSGCAERCDRLLAEGGDLGGLRLGQLDVVGHVTVRNEHQVTGRVRVEVQHDVRSRTTPDDEPVLVVFGGDAAKRAPLPRFGACRLVLTLDVRHPMRTPEALERIGRTCHTCTLRCTASTIRAMASSTPTRLSCSPLRKRNET